MADLNIPNDNISNEFKLDSTSSFSQSLSKSQKINSPEKDFLTDRLSDLSQFEKIKYRSDAIKNEYEIPQLKSPEVDETVSYASFLETIAMANLKTKQALKASEINQLRQRYLQSQELSNEVMTYVGLEEARNDAYEKLNPYIDNLILSLDKTFDEINEEIKEMQLLVDQFNAGSAESKQACVNLLNAYEKMLNDLADLGIVANDGAYSVPLDQAEAYNAIVSEYQLAVDEFNAYWTERNAEIDTVNEAINNYNLTIMEYQQELDNFSDLYEIPGFYPIPLVDPLDKMAGEIVVPPLIPSGEDSNTFIVLYIPPPPEQVTIYSKYALEAVRPNYYSLSAKSYQSHLYASLSNQIDVTYNRILEEGMEYWTFLSNSFDKNLENDPLTELTLNEKPFFLKLLKLNAEFEEERELKLENIQSEFKQEHVLIDQLVQKEVKVILGDELHQEVLKGMSSLNESQIHQLSSYLDVLSLQVINQNLLNALLPGLKPLGNLIASLPKDSPAYGLLFAVSFLNRTIEHVSGGMSKVAVDALMNKMPEFASLSDEIKTALAGNMNIGLLLIAGKFVEANLGLTELLPQILSQSLDFPLNRAGRQETDLTEQYIHQGFSATEAAFLSGVANELLQQGVLAPSASVVSEQTVNQSLLINSLKGALVLSGAGIDLKQAEEMALSAVNHLLLENPKSTLKHFRQSLEDYLKEEGIDHAQEIVKETVVAAKQNPGTEASQIQNYLLQLLSPQLGMPLAKEIADEIQISLFGKTAQDPIHTQSPYFLTHSMKNEVEKTYSEENKAYGKKQKEAFEKSLETSLNLSAFLLKMMDPAYSLLYSSETSLIYPSNTKERPLII